MVFLCILCIFFRFYYWCNEYYFLFWFDYWCGFSGYYCSYNFDKVGYYYCYYNFCVVIFRGKCVVFVYCRKEFLYLFFVYYVCVFFRRRIWRSIGFYFGCVNFSSY